MLLQSFLATPTMQKTDRVSFRVWAADRKWEAYRLPRNYLPEDVARAFEIASLMDTRCPCEQRYMRFVTQMETGTERWLSERLQFCPACCTVTHVSESNSPNQIIHL